jgi:hypothetical protein
MNIIYYIICFDIVVSSIRSTLWSSSVFQFQPLFRKVVSTPSRTEDCNDTVFSVINYQVIFFEEAGAPQPGTDRGNKYGNAIM